MIKLVFILILSLSALYLSILMIFRTKETLAIYISWIRENSEINRLLKRNIENDAFAEIKFRMIGVGIFLVMSLLFFATIYVMMTQPKQL